MRIGIFTESYQPLINGVSTSVRTLIAELERMGHTIFVFTSHFPNYIDDRSGVFRFPSVNSVVEPNYVLPVPFAPQIMRAIPDLKLDIVHSHSPFLLGLIAQQVARRYRLPLISTNHTLYTEYAHYFPLAPPPLTRLVLVRWMRRYYNGCDWVLAPSELTRQKLVGYGIKKPITVAPTGIPTPPYVLTSAGAIKEELGLPRNARLLLYVGRLAPEKNLGMLLQAFARIAVKSSNTFLVLAGSGKSDAYYRRYAQQLGLADRVVFTGFVDRTKLDPLYLAADLFLFPSKTETQGLAIGEALAAGTPCVIVDAGGAPESIKNGVDGFLVEDNPQQMAERALLLLENDAMRQAMSEAARLHAREFAPENVARRLIAIYEKLLGRTAAELRNSSSQAPPPSSLS